MWFDFLDGFTGLGDLTGLSGLTDTGGLGSYLS